MGKHLFGLALLVLLAAGSLGHVPRPFVPGKHYEYSYETLVSAFLPDLDDQNAGHHLECDVHLDVLDEQVLHVQLKDVKFAKVHDHDNLQHEDAKFSPLRMPQDFVEDLLRPVRVQFKGGMIDVHHLNSEDSNESGNVKRAILQMLQIPHGLLLPYMTQASDRHPLLHKYWNNTMSDFEDGLTGNCETDYEVVEVEDFFAPELDNVLLTKIRNYLNCTSKQRWEHDEYDYNGCPWVCGDSITGDDDCEPGCPYGYTQDVSPVRKFGVTKYNITFHNGMPLVRDICHEGKISYDIHGDTAAIYTNQTLELVTVEPIRTPIPPPRNPEIHESLEYHVDDEDEKEIGDIHMPYYHLFTEQIKGDDNVQRLINHVKYIADIIYPETKRDQEHELLGLHIRRAVRILGVMKREQLMTCYRTFHSQRSTEAERLYWKVFREILSEAKSPEVAHFIHELIMKNELTEKEMVEFLTSLPASIVDPDTDLVDKYMDLLEKFHKQSGYLRNHLSIAVAKLLNSVCVDPEEVTTTEEDHPMKQTYSHHPEEFLVEKEGKSTYRGMKKTSDDDECDEEDFKKYLHRFHTILHDTTDIPSLVNYIEALAHTGDVKVLQYLLPYLTEENEICRDVSDDDDDDCRYIRIIALYSLHHLVADDTDKILDIVEPIYFTPSEDPRIRIAAFSVYMFADPSIRSLQRVATELQDEEYDHVGSYVYSAMQHMGNSSLPCFQKLSQKIKYVFSHLPEEYDNGIQFAKFISHDYYDDESDFGFAHYFSYVPDEDTSYMNNGYFGLMHNLANLMAEPLKIKYNMKGLDRLFSRFDKIMGNKKTVNKNTDYMNKLNIKPREPEDFQMRLYMKFFENSYHYTWDEKHIDWLVNRLYKIYTLPSQITEGHRQLLRIFLPLDHTVIVPTAMGFPALLVNRHPTIFYANLEYKAISKDAIYVHVYPKIHHESHVMAAIVHPETEVMSGVMVRSIYHLALPFELELTWNMDESRFGLTFKPKVPHTVFFHVNRPATFTHDHWMDGPVGHDIVKDFEPIRILDEPAEFVDEIGHEILGMGLKTHIKSDTPWSGLPIFWSETAEEDGIIAAIVEAYQNPGWNYRKVVTVLEHDDEQPIDEFHVSFKYNYNPVAQKKNFVGKDFFDSERHESHEGKYEDNFQYRNPEKKFHPAAVPRREMTWNKVATAPFELPIDTKVAHEIVMNVGGKGPRTEFNWALVGRYEYNYHENDTKVVIHAKRLAGPHNSEDTKVCLLFRYMTTPIPDEFTLDLKSFDDMEGKIIAAVNWGKNCESRPNIKIVGELSKADEWLQEVSSGSAPWYFQQCKEDMRSGDSLSYACELAIEDASEFDELDLDIVYDEKEIPDWMQDYTYDIMVYLKQAFYQNLNQTLAVNNRDGHIKVHFEFDDIIVPIMNMTIETPDEEMTLENVGMDIVPIPSGLYSLFDSFIRDVTDYGYPAVCTVSEDYVSTFDNVTIDMPDTDCRYLLAADCSGEENIAISFKEINARDNTKIVRIVLGEHIVELFPAENRFVPVKINGEDIQLTEENILRPCIKEDCIVVRIQKTLSEQTRPIVVVEDDDTDFTIVYNGVALKIYAPMSHQGVQCGICGEFNDEEYLDFVGPQECVFEDEEDFVKSYIYPGTCSIDPRHYNLQGRKRCPDTSATHHTSGKQSNYKPYWQKETYSKELTKEHQWYGKEHTINKEHQFYNKDHTYTKENQWTPKEYTMTKEHHFNKEYTPFTKEHTPYTHQTKEFSQKMWQNTRDSHVPEYQPSFTRQWGQGVHQQTEKPNCIHRETLIEKKSTETCFSIEPIRVCHDTSSCTEYITRDVAFHCMPKNSEQARYIEEKVHRNGVAEVMQMKSVDFVKNIKVPTQCTHRTRY